MRLTSAQSTVFVYHGYKEAFCERALGGSTEILALHGTERGLDVSLIRVYTGVEHLAPPQAESVSTRCRYVNDLPISIVLSQIHTVNLSSSVSRRRDNEDHSLASNRRTRREDKSLGRDARLSQDIVYARRVSLTENPNTTHYFTHVICVLTWRSREISESVPPFSERSQSFRHATTVLLRVCRSDLSQLDETSSS
ncbi:hypothetical protein Tco_1122800 [Tanacetum coccineum]|uniref:Uncharacterized protein n=1 Tax=Tanacetum coccineum TaxID=301880 RepID=A0ABQ5AHI4_9ASTR